MPATVVPRAARKAPARLLPHCRGQRLLDEVGLRVPASVPAAVVPAVVPAGEGPDTAPIPRPARPQPSGIPAPGAPRERRGNRPGRGPGGPTGPQPTGPGRHRARTSRTAQRQPERQPVRQPARRGPVSRPDLELPRHWTVHFEVLDGVNDGKVKLSSPQARGWAKVIRPFPDAVKEAITEARIYVAEQGHAAWTGNRVPLDVLTEYDDPGAPPPPKVADLAEVKARAEKKWQRTFSKDSLVRPDQDDLTQWTLLPPKPDGTPGGWQSKRGRYWRVPPKGVLRKRREAGLPTTWEELQGGAVASG